MAYSHCDARRGLVFAIVTLTAASACTSETDVATNTEVASTTQALTLQQHIDVCNADPRVLLGLVPLDVCVGADLFFREAFGGNGRTCGSCHPAGHNFTIDASFIATLPASDPLFVAENVQALAGLERPDLMRQFGLILENVDNTSDPTVRFTMRSVPHCFSLNTSIARPSVLFDGTTVPPKERTGWSGDGAPGDGELRDFQTGAIIQHYTNSLTRTAGTDFVLATSDELNNIRAFTGSIGRSNELTLDNLVLTDAGAETGRTTFTNPVNRCNFCHLNAGANNPLFGGNANFNTGVERARIAVLNSPQQNIPFDGGFGGGTLTSFNFDANGDGTPDSFGNGTFNTPPLIEAADTGPFFHTNAFNTIEQAITFYTSPEFGTSPSGPAIPLSATDITNIGRFLRVLNAAFNCQLAIKRIEGVIPIIDDQKNHFSDLQRTLAGLALAEVNDALSVLSGVSNLNASAQTQLLAAQSALTTASTHSSHTQRLQAAQSALTAVVAANASLTSTPSALSFSMGAGTLMF